MSRHGFSRPVAVRRSSSVSHDQWMRERLTGAMDLALSTLSGRFVSPGTGRLALSTAPGAETVFHRAARSAGLPVLPGSGIKGAVRTVYELLSASCNPFVSTPPTCGRKDVCDACSLFGARGYSGRVSFGDGVASGDTRREIRWLPVGHEPDGTKTQGDFRLYDLAPQGSQPHRGGQEPARAAREVYLGKFRTRLSFVNLTPEELGRLLLCCGLEAPGALGFPLRLGGVKYEGQGAMRVEVETLALHGVAIRDQKPAAEQAVGWIEQALASTPWAETFEPIYRELANTLRHGEPRS